MQTTAEPTDIRTLTFFELQEQPAEVKAIAVRDGLATPRECESCGGFGYVETAEFYEDDMGELIEYGAGDTTTCGHCYGEGIVLMRPCDEDARKDAEQAERQHHAADLELGAF